MVVITESIIPQGAEKEKGTRTENRNKTGKWRALAVAAGRIPLRQEGSGSNALKSAVPFGKQRTRRWNRIGIRHIDSKWIKRHDQKKGEKGYSFTHCASSASPVLRVKVTRVMQPSKPSGAARRIGR